METLDKSILALRKFLLENKEKVAHDLENMRKASKGNDIFNYVENLSSAFSFENLNYSTQITFGSTYSDFDYYDISYLISKSYTPPNKKTNKAIKKGSENLTESFFLTILRHVRGKTSCIFLY